MSSSASIWYSEVVDTNPNWDSSLAEWNMLRWWLRIIVKQPSKSLYRFISSHYWLIQKWGNLGLWFCWYLWKLTGYKHVFLVESVARCRLEHFSQYWLEVSLWTVTTNVAAVWFYLGNTISLTTDIANCEIYLQWLSHSEGICWLINLSIHFYVC